MPGSNQRLSQHSTRNGGGLGHPRITPYHFELIVKGYPIQDGFYATTRKCIPLGKGDLRHENNRHFRLVIDICNRLIVRDDKIL